MKKNILIPKETRESVVSYCNNHIVPDDDYIENPMHNHPIEWFMDYFSFIPDNALQKYLAEAYYQARFVYKIMQGLHLTSFKKTAFLKFQIQQYASIYEALLDFILETYHRNEIAESILKAEEYRPVPAFSNNTELSITMNSRNEKVHPCIKKYGKRPLKTVKIDDRTNTGVALGIIDLSIKEALDALYDLRNNIHLLKAAEANYRPTIKECEGAFRLMPKIVDQIKSHIASLNQ